MKRRNILVGLGAGLVAGCSKIGESQPMQTLFGLAQDWHRGAQRTLAGRQALAREFSPADISPVFRGNGTTSPDDPAYKAHANTSFANWNLAVAGLIEHPLQLSLAQVRALPQRTQITRHDCVEGWSAIGQWTGPQLKTILEMAKLKPEARYIVFHCADLYHGMPYYESVDLVDAFHPQTIVAHQLNGEPLPVKNGAPLRMRIERQLGYKHAKYLQGIEAVASLDSVGRGKGGYWEDQVGYQWYAGV
jgi:DMSO/TMAO reductase YedYZ molybdopterin-dependent catalytic subunit